MVINSLHELHVSRSRVVAAAIGWKLARADQRRQVSLLWPSGHSLLRSSVCTRFLLLAKSCSFKFKNKMQFATVFFCMQTGECAAGGGGEQSGAQEAHRPVAQDLPGVVRRLVSARAHDHHAHRLHERQDPRAHRQAVRPVQDDGGVARVPRRRLRHLFGRQVRLRGVRRPQQLHARGHLWRRRRPGRGRRAPGAHRERAHVSEAHRAGAHGLSGLVRLR